MANVIRHKRGTSDPVAGDFSQTAELLVNTIDGGLFTKTDGGSVVEIGGGDLSVDSLNFSGNGDRFITSTGVDSWTYRAEFSVASQESEPRDIAFKADGTKMYVVGASGDDVNEYDLSTAWDITTASYLQRFVVSSQETAPQGLFFKPDGTKMFVVGSTGDDVNEYSLSTAWNVTTASYVQNFSVSSKENSPLAVAFKSDGTKMYITGSSSDSIHEYTLSTGWDLSTASFNQSFSVATYSSVPEGLDFSDDGTEVYIAGRGYNRIVKYALSTAWDISTATFADFVSVSLLGDHYVNSVSGLKVKSSANRAYVCDYGVDRVFELTTNTPATEFDGTRFIAASDAHFREDVIIYSNLRVDDEIFCRQNAYIDGSITVRGAVDLADSDVLRFGSSDDWKFFYNGTTNVAHVELESAVVSLNITDNGTDILTVTRSTGVVALTATPTVNGNSVWHAGNDGSGSGLDADTLDGQQGSYYAPLASPTFTGTPAAPTASAGTNTTQVATTAFVQTAIANVVDSAPAALDTLNELAAALGDDANFSTTVTNSIGTKLPLAGGQMTGNITFSSTQTVDGRDLSVDGAKLDGIEAGATADQTASEILTAIKTVDGSGSGLDADTVDGVEATSFLRSDASDSFSGTLTYTGSDIAVDTGGDNIKMGTMTIVGSNGVSGWATKPGIKLDSTNDFRIHAATGDATLYVDGEIYAGASAGLHKVWHAGNDGSGTGLDADTVDGVHASSFFQANNALSATTGAFSGDVTMSGTGALKVANGTTAQRPTASNGQIRYNTTLGAIETYVQGAWQVIANTALDYGLITTASDTTFDYGALV